jgi:dual specificity tyrosine-phosphorylation-regulated kinase 2/3/4
MIGKILENRFEIISKIAEGGFSRVYQVFESSTQKSFALKVAKREFRSRRAAQTEVKTLNMLKNHENICQLVEEFSFEGNRCLVFPLYEMSLFHMLSRTAYEGLPVKMVKVLARQLLRTLKYLHRLGLCHADLKPENVFVESLENIKIRLGDFGCSFVGKINRPGYMQSRFYRAPEVILDVECDYSIDIWSFGCVVSELYTGIPLFQGRDNSDQLARIISVLGPPPESYTKFASDDLQDIIKTSTQTRTLQVELRSTQEFSDFISNCLQYENRSSAESLLSHPFLSC